MPTKYPESLWRCPSDGAFHVVDMADCRFDMDQYRCTKCEGWVNAELVQEGMANAINQPVAPPVYDSWLNLRVVFSDSDVDVHIHDKSGRRISSDLVYVERDGDLIKVMYHAEGDWKPALVCRDQHTARYTVMGQATVKTRRWDDFKMINL